MQTLIEHLNKQLISNKGKNIFHSERKGLFTFIPDTVLLIDKLSGLDSKTEDFLLSYISGKAMEEFCDMNQYYSFNEEAKDELKLIYTKLLSALKAGSDIEKVSENHFLKLQEWLQDSNPFSEQMYKKEGEKTSVVPCAEYSPELQISLLRIDLARIVQPVLDIGCGKNGALVSYLQELGIETYGIDRFAKNIGHCSSADWLSFEYKKNYWGTIISNLGFSNHFVHHHLREDGDFINYAKTYMQILQSLRPGGTFYYAPGLSFIEDYLDKKEYLVSNHEIGQNEYLGSKITRIF